MTASRKMGIMRVVHRLAALWLLASAAGSSLGEAAMSRTRDRRGGQQVSSGFRTAMDGE